MIDKTLSDFKLVHVEWIDSRGAGNRWNHYEKFILEPDDHVKCVSVGYLILDNGKNIIVAPHSGDTEDPDNLQFCGEMTIPKVCITTMTELLRKE